MKTRPILFGFLATIAFSASLTAEGYTYLKIEGITGESRSESHKDWIEVISVSTPRDKGTDMATRKRSPQILVVTKRIGKSTPLLFEARSSNRVFREIAIEEEGVKMYASGVTVASIRPIDATTEEVTFRCESISKEPQKPREAHAAEAHIQATAPAVRARN